MLKDNTLLLLIVSSHSKSSQGEMSIAHLYLEDGAHTHAHTHTVFSLTNLIKHYKY